MGENDVEWHGQRSRSPGASNTAGSPGACKFPDTASGWPSARGTKPDQRPVFEGMRHPVGDNV